MSVQTFSATPLPHEREWNATDSIVAPVAQPQESIATGLFLLTAFGVVAAGSAVVDYTRLPLLLIPLSCWLASLGAARMLEHLCGELVPDEPSEAPRMIVRLTVGLACLSLTAVIAGMVGMFPFAAAVTFCCAAIEVFAMFRSGAFIVARPWRFSTVVAAIPFGIFALFGWLWTTIPPTFYDELAYHLVVPERAAATGALPLYPWVFFNLMPHTSDVLLTWGMIWADGIGARAMHWGLWAVCLAAAWGGSAAIAGHRASPWVTVLLTLVLASSPTFWFLGSLPFSETTLALALLGVLLAVVRPSDRRPWLAVGCLLGLAAAAKLTGIAWALSALVALKVIGWSWTHVARASVVTMVWMLPWWSRAYRATGDPFYPLLWRWRGGTPWSEASQVLAQGDLPPGLASLGLAGLAQLPWDIVVHPERFASAGDVGLLAVLSVGLALLLPAVVRARSQEPHDRRLADACAVFIVLSCLAWLAASSTTRFYAPAFIFCMVMATGLTARLGRYAVMIALVSAIPLCVTGSGRYFQTHQAVFESARVALGQESREQYLIRTLGYYKAAQFASKELPSDSRILFIGEFRSYYFDRDVLAPSPYDRHPLEAWVESARSPEDLARRLAAEGITHVVLNTREFARLQKQYRILTFTGEDAPVKDRILRMLPRVLQTLYADRSLYVLQVPSLDQYATPQ